MRAEFENRAAVAWALHYETKWGDNFNGDGMSPASKLLRAVRAFQKVNAVQTKGSK